MTDFLGLIEASCAAQSKMPAMQAELDQNRSRGRAGMPAWFRGHPDRKGRPQASVDDTLLKAKLRTCCVAAHGRRKVEDKFYRKKWKVTGETRCRRVWVMILIGKVTRWRCRARTCPGLAPS